MANKLKAVVSADIKQFMSSMNSVGLAASSASLAAVGAFAAVASGILAMTKETVDASKSFETLKIRLQLLAGDMKAGAEEFEFIRERAKRSSFETDKLIDAYVRLRATAGKEFALKNLDNISYAANVANVSLSTMASRVGELAIRIETGLSGALLKKSLRTFATALGREGVLSLTKLVDAGASSAKILDKLQESLNRFGEAGREAFEESAEGLEDRLGGLVKDIFAKGGEGGGGALDSYKEILKAIINTLQELESSGALDELKNAISRVAEQIAEMTKDESFMSFLLSTIELVTAATNAFAIFLKTLREVISVYNGAVNSVATLSNWIEGRGAATPTGKSVTAQREREAAEAARFNGGRSLEVKVINTGSDPKYAL